jgi:hypothetical protein
LLVPLAGWFERWPTLAWPKRTLGAALLGLSIPFQAWLASHSIFQVFWELNVEHGKDRYMALADWDLAATPPIAFWNLQQPALEFARAGNWAAARTSAKFDALGFGAWRLAQLTDADGLWHMLRALGIAGAIAAAVLAWWFWTTRRPRRLGGRAPSADTSSA